MVKRGGQPLTQIKNENWQKMKTTDNNKAAQEFVQDDFYNNKGKQSYKMRQIAVAVFSWVVLLYPLLIMLNSVGRKPLFSFIYRWNSEQGRLFTEYITIVAIIGIFVIGTASLLLLRQNNRMETEKLVRQKFYDEQKNQARLGLMEDIYTERFGEKIFRENVRDYVVAPEQNFSRSYLRERYKEKGF